MSKKTALYDEHVKLKGKIVDFAGWMLPVQYEGLAVEHAACRNSVGLFDVSHMGEIIVKGPGALSYLNHLVTNDVSKIVDNQAIYSPMCYENGGCIDDLIIYRVSAEEFFICVNASNVDKDFEWIKSHAPKDVTITNDSLKYSQIAIQGRNSQAVLQKTTKIDLSSIKYYWFQKGIVSGEQAMVARTGYTGEDGFEIYIPWDSAPKVWNELMTEGAKYNIKPCGLGARDTLRTEMKFALYGHEIDQNTNPIEAGISWTVKLNKPDFIGKKALVATKEAGLQRKSVGLKSLGKQIPRQGYEVEAGGKKIGIVTSGTMSPSLNVGIAIASVEPEFSKVGTKLDVVIRGQKVEHIVVETPFYKRPY